MNRRDFLGTLAVSGAVSG
ncbi:MAG: twin-arginine translocation signal domain-containing protein, partial [Bryobacteraceae bacterium]